MYNFISILIHCLLEGSVFYKIPRHYKHLNLSCSFLVFDRMPHSTLPVTNTFIFVSRYNFNIGVG